MTNTAVVETVWDVYARDKPPRRATNASGETTWFNWTQYADHGPDAGLLGIQPGSVVLDLGCGSGGNLAHVAELGARAVGVDVSAVQLDKARDRWPDAGLDLRQVDAVDYLASTAERFDAIYSVFGAAWFTDPDMLLPAVRARLASGGVFAFSQRPPVEGCYGCQAAFIKGGDDEEQLVVKRWDYPPEVWVGRLTGYGFVRVTAEIVTRPEGGRGPGTLLVRAIAP